MLGGIGGHGIGKIAVDGCSLDINAAKGTRAHVPPGWEAVKTMRDMADLLIVPSPGRLQVSNARGLPRGRLGGPRLA